MKILITGAAGFFGHHVIRYLLDNTEHDITGIDALVYSGNLDRLRDIGALDDPRLRILTMNFALPIEDNFIREVGPVDVILHLGAETHVDDSIKWPEKFVTANVMGTVNMLQWARKLPNLKRFVYFSTDEVFGPAPQGVTFTETDLLNPTNPYSATKAAGEHMTRAFGNTYKVPYIITRTMNLFGERQHPQKFIPLVVRKIMNMETITVHADPETGVSGSRFYVHCRTVAAALMHAVMHGKNGEVYNITGDSEVSNLDIVRSIGRILHAPVQYTLTDYSNARPGHDPRYAISDAKLRATGWESPSTFDEDLIKTVRWFEKNRGWLNA